MPKLIEQISTFILTGNHPHLRYSFLTLKTLFQENFDKRIFPMNRNFH